MLSYQILISIRIAFNCAVIYLQVFGIGVDDHVNYQTIISANSDRTAIIETFKQRHLLYDGETVRLNVQHKLK